MRKRKHNEFDKITMKQSVEFAKVDVIRKLLHNEESEKEIPMEEKNRKKKRKKSKNRYMQNFFPIAILHNNSRASKQERKTHVILHNYI